MTVIAWDGKTLAADKRATDQYGRRWSVSKIGRTPNGELYGLTGDEAVARELLAWWLEGASRATFPSSARDDKASLVIVTADAELLWFTKAPISVMSFRGCFGSGAEMAAMAMLCGKSAAEAVALTAEMSAWCGDGVDTLTLENQ